MWADKGDNVNEVEDSNPHDETRFACAVRTLHDDLAGQHTDRRVAGNRQPEAHSWRRPSRRVTKGRFFGENNLSATKQGT
jgi:hypothetical protein